MGRPITQEDINMIKKMKFKKEIFFIVLGFYSSLFFYYFYYFYIKNKLN